MSTVNVDIHDVAFGGKGVGHDNGKALFIPYTITGERVRAKLVRDKKQYAEAELIEVLARSPDRVDPRCPYFGRCGGCSYQHIEYGRQLELKTRQVEKAVQRIGKIQDPPMRPIVPSPLPYGYRNRITVHVQDDVIGFYRRDAHELMDIEHCPISMVEVNNALAELRSARPRNGHYSLRAHPGPRVFAQTNDAVAAAIAEFIATTLNGGETVLIDAFCGAGFFSKHLAPRFQRVIGIDWDRFAIDAAQKTASATESYRAGDVEVELQSLLEQTDLASTALIVDPPATGLSV